RDGHVTGVQTCALPIFPEDTLILIPTRNLVLFPGTVLPITLGRQRTIAAAQAAIKLNRPLGLLLQRDPATDDPIPVDLHRMGTRSEERRVGKERRSQRA